MLGLLAFLVLSSTSILAGGAGENGMRFLLINKGIA
jgi:hypothetical protein